MSVDGEAKVVIIGAGVVGCAVAEHLVALGCTGVLVLDQGPLFLTGGSTSHAPGLVFQTNPSRTMTRFASYTAEHFGELRHEGESCFKDVGSIEVARTPERLDWLRLRHGLAGSWGVASGLLDPAAVAELVPLVDPERILGGFHVPSDGIAKAVWAAEAMAERARQGGARFVGGVKVTGIDVADGRVRAVETAQGPVRCELAVSCAGMWGPLLGRMAGASVPLVPMQHQFAWTHPLPELAGDASREVRHPILRDQDSALYFRQRSDRYGIGSYQHEPLPLRPEELREPQDGSPMPSVLPFTERHFEAPWRDATDLLPALAGPGLADTFNGLFSFTPDGGPLLGETPEVRGLWLAEAVWITHSAGVGRAVAEWIVGGAPGLDVRECDIGRFEPFARSPAYVQARSCQQYDEVYDVVHPMQPMERPRPLRVSPFYPRQQALGACFLEAGGWERPQWYEANEPLTRDLDVPCPDAWAGRYWSPIVAAEHLATRSGVALFDMTSLKRVEVAGPGALGLLQRLTTSNLDRRPGYVTYTLLLDERAGVRSDVTVARLGATRFQVGCNGQRDVLYLERQAPADGSVWVRDVTGATCCAGLWGPRARDVLQQLTPDDVSNEGFGFFRAREIRVGEVPVTALRLSYVGELGWELYTTADLGLRLWDLLWEAGEPHGIVAGGRGAFNGLRLEKGYRAWGQDVWSEHDPDAAGLGFAVRLDKGEFVGREALIRRRERPGDRRLCCLVLDDGAYLLGKEPVLAGGEPAGFVTSAAYGYTVGGSIAYAWLPEALAAPGTHVEVEELGRRHGATVSPEPLYDPEMARMRA